MSNELTITALAQASAQTEPQGKLSKARADIAKKVGAGMVDALVVQATLAAKKALTPDTSAAWGAIIETLDALELTTSMTCAKTGRFIYELQESHFTAHLDEMTRLGDTPQGDRVQSQLIGAIETQKAYVALPSTIVTSAGNMAFIRAACPLDYAMIALQDAFPRPLRASSSALAHYAEQLHHARNSLDELEPAALAYLCECLHLYLSNIKPDTIAAQDANNTLAHYREHSIGSIVETPAKIAHLCRRIVQLAFNLIAKHQTRDFTQLTTKDIINLRVHYQGLPQYKEQQAVRRMNDEAKRMQAKIADAKRSSRGNRELSTAQSRAILETLDLNDFDSFEENVLDMVAAFSTVLKADIKIGAETPEQANTYREIAKTAQPETAPAGMFNLSDLGEDYDEFLPTIEDESDLLAHGFAEVDEYDEFLQGVDADEDEDDSAPLLDTFETPTSLAMKQATRVALKPLVSKPTQPPAAPTPPKPANRAFLMAAPKPLK